MLNVQSMITAGLVAEMGEKNFITLCVIASFGEKNGFCPATQTEIAKRMGVSRKVAIKRIDSLKEYYWKDQPIVARTSLGYVIPEGFVKLYTRIHKIGNTVDSNSLNKQSNRITVRTVLTEFAIKFKEAYGFEYNFSYAADSKSVKKLIDLYGGNKTLKIVEAAFNYKHLFTSPQYPMLTIRQLVTFVPNLVMDKIIAEAKLDHSDFNETMRQSDKYKEYFGKD